jgi:predicted transcriptional regulator YdeE/uncharacterized protein YndB with AHSA1/START domain
MPIVEQQQAIQTFEIVKEEEIAAPIDIVFESILEQMGPFNENPDKSPLPMKLEAWPGGRWFRDLGNNTGHWWGNVQAIKPPSLLEICGPLFMSYPAASNVQYRLSEENGITRLKFVHRAMGWSMVDLTEGADKGWTNVITKIHERALRSSDRFRIGGRSSHLAGQTPLKPVRLERFEGMTAVGLKGRFAFGGDPRIGEQWNQFSPHIGKVPGQVGSAAYGICWNLDEGGLDCMSAVEVSKESAPPSGLVKESIPAATFAVFLHHGHVSEIPKTMGGIYEGLATSGYEIRRDKDVPGLIELYDERFDPQTLSGEVELWIPVK